MSKILIIEDEKNLARFVELELKHEGYETEVHFNGRTGLEAALAEDWDAILLDLMLPELNGLEELLARLRALLRRISIEGENNTAKQTTIKYRDLVIEKENRVVRRGDDIIELTKREYELLLTLMENVNVVLARDVLLSKVWGYNSDVETNVVDVYVRYIRNKIDRPGEPSYIQTVRGTGYVMRS